jgi:hypothetical protein
MVHSIRGMGKRNEHQYKIEMEAGASAIQFSRGIEAAEPPCESGGLPVNGSTKPRFFPLPIATKPRA